MLKCLDSYWGQSRRYGAGFWAVHLIGGAAIFFWGMRTASRQSVSIAAYRILRAILAR